MESEHRKIYMRDIFVTFRIPSVTTVKVLDFWDVTPCSLVMVKMKVRVKVKVK
jgi:hypothetical protein